MSSVLTSRERLRRAYFHEEMDRPAVYTRTGYPGDDPTYDEVKRLMQTASDLKDTWSADHLVRGPEIAWRNEPHNADFERCIQTLTTPAGDLRATTLLSLKGQPGLHETHFLKDRADAEKYLSQPMPSIEGSVDAFFTADRAMGDRGIVDVCLGSNPGGFAAELFGSENFAFASVTDRDIVHALLERRMRIMLGLAEYLLAQGVGPFFSMLGEEYIVPPLHGPADFDDFNVKYDKPIIDLIHAAGGRVHVHSHGSIRTVLAGFLAMGVDVLHPFEAPPMGDITPAAAKKLIRGRLCYEGNIQIAHMYERGPDEIRAQTEALIADVFDDRRGLIAAPSASPYLRGMGRQCLPQYKAMVETVQAYGA